MSEAWSLYKIKNKILVKSKIQVKRRNTLHSQIKDEIIKVKEKFGFENCTAEEYKRKRLLFSNSWIQHAAAVEGQSSGTDPEW